MLGCSYRSPPPPSSGGDCGVGWNGTRDWWTIFFFSAERFFWTLTFSSPLAEESAAGSSFSFTFQWWSDS